MYYIHKDYQGNMETISDENGQVLEKLSFDPWGRKRNSDNWTYTKSNAQTHFDRGYTMHEHIDLFGLINMNGRLYDPWVGRMLSPDPYLQNPSNLQNYNRYSYALNNPLKYTDPSGYNHKPADWNQSAVVTPGAFSRGGGGGRTPMEGYNLRHTYTVDNNGVLRNGYGEQVSSDEYNTYLESTGKFDNFVEQNSIRLPNNTVLSSIVTSSGGFNYYTIDPTSSPMWSSSTTEFNLHFVWFMGSGGDGITGISKHTAVTYGLFGTGVWANTVKAGFDAAKRIQPTVSTWAKGSLAFGRGTNILSGITVGYDFVTGTANTSTLVNIGVSVVGYGVIAIVGVAAAPYVIGAGVVYGVVSVAGGDKWLNNTWDNSHINSIKP